MPSSEKTLVTGAGGFIGGRLVEVMLQSEDRTPVAGVRRWSTVARIGRYPIDAVPCDLMNPEQIAAALDGVGSIVHCAVGSAEVTREGTRNLLAAALEAGIRKVVHVSTIDVYGAGDGVFDDDHPLEKTGRDYGDSKIDAEAICGEFVERGLDIVILRPTIVYGPFSDNWTIEPAQRLSDGTWRFAREACQGTCNLVYVDDVVRAILRGLEADGLQGRAYNVNGPDDVTWQDYIEALNRALERPELQPPGVRESQAQTRVVDPLRNLIKGIYSRFEDPIMELYKSSKPARRAMKWLQASLLKVPSSNETQLFARRASFPSHRAAQELGFTPVVDMQRGVALSAQWLEHERIVTPVE